MSALSPHTSRRRELCHWLRHAQLPLTISITQSTARAALPALVPLPLVRRHYVEHVATGERRVLIVELWANGIFEVGIGRLYGLRNELSIYLGFAND